MREVPNHDQLLALMNALLSNAMALVDDASVLYEHERFPRAYALSALAGEELGKVYLCLDALLAHGEYDGQQFWRGWRQHGDKLDSMRAFAAAFVEDLEDLDVDQLGPDAKRIGVQKLSAFYVDFDGHRPLTPDRLTQGEAADLLQRTRLSVNHAHEALSGLNENVLAAAHMLGPVMEAFFEQLLDNRPPREALADLRQLLVDAPGMTVDEISALLISTGDVIEDGTPGADR